MRRATCRCGQALTVPGDGTERVICPSCGARVRIRRGVSRNSSSDGYIRFFCPCGRRLKVSAVQPPQFGKCPDCSRVVPVPTAADASGGGLIPGSPETPTAELSVVDAAALDEWSRRHLGGAAIATGASSTAIQSQRPTGRAEAGLRVCPRCGKPVHLSAVTCRACGAPVPKR